MLRREIVILDSLLDKESLTKTCKQLLDNPYAIDGIGLPVEYLHLMGDYFDHIEVIPQIDIFSGLSRHKAQDLIYASSFKVDKIDVKINEFLVVNDKVDLVFGEIECLCKIAKDKNKSLRIVFDYRMIEPHLDDLMGLVRFSDVDTVITSVGLRVNDPIDEIIIADQIKTKFGINVMCTLSVNKKDCYNMLKETDSVYGVRFTSLGFLDSLLTESKPLEKK